jgi:hypothetical protein
MWDIIKNKLPSLQKEIQSILKKEKWHSAACYDRKEIPACSR